MRFPALISVWPTLLAVACGSPSSGEVVEVVPDHQVLVQNGGYSPTALTARPGDLVRFSWPDGALQHSVVPAPPGIQPRASLRDGPSMVDVTFSAVGVFRFYCGNHGGLDAQGMPIGMSGQVAVAAAPPPPPPPPPPSPY